MLPFELALHVITCVHEHDGEEHEQSPRSTSTPAVVSRVPESRFACQLVSAVTQPNLVSHTARRKQKPGGKNVAKLARVGHG